MENLCSFATCLDNMGQLFVGEVKQIEFELLVDPSLCKPELVAKLAWIQDIRSSIERATGTSGLIH